MPAGSSWSAVDAALLHSIVADMLDGFARAPARYLREWEFQAALWARAVDAFDRAGPALPVKAVLTEDGTPSRHKYGPLTTGRVHGEVEVWSAPGGQKIRGPHDLVVLGAAATPTLFCTSKGGPTDFKSRLLGSDIAAAIEMKAMPTNWRASPDVPTACAEDLKKLAAVKKHFPHVDAVFVLFDKSLELPGLRSGAKPATDWAAEAGLRLDLEPAESGAAVQVHELLADAAGALVPACRYWNFP